MLYFKEHEAKEIICLRSTTFVALMFCFISFLVIPTKQASTTDPATTSRQTTTRKVIPPTTQHTVTKRLLTTTESDPCSLNPCNPLVSCTKVDRTLDPAGFKCGKCPAGYLGDGINCRSE